jgi:hypothetical protein
MLMLDSTVLKLDGMVERKGDASDTEDYTIVEVVTLGEVDGSAAGWDDIGERIMEEGTRMEVDTTNSFPDVNVLMIVELTPSGSDVDMLVTEVLIAACGFEAVESRFEEAGTEGEGRMIERPVRLGGAMLLSHSVEPLIIE